MKKNLEQRIKEASAEKIEIVSYNPVWIDQFKSEAEHLRKILPDSIILRIEHFGSTAIPGMSAKPIIDILIEVTDLQEIKNKIALQLIRKGYEYFWRPTFSSHSDYYAWFIKRNADAKRSHHLHMVEADSILWDSLLFRDYLREHPAEAKKYEKLKRFLSVKYPNDRMAYTKGKNDYIKEITRRAKK